GLHPGEVLRREHLAQGAHLPVRADGDHVVLLPGRLAVVFEHAAAGHVPHGLGLTELRTHVGLGGHALPQPVHALRFAARQPSHASSLHAIPPSVNSGPGKDPPCPSSHAPTTPPTRPSSSNRCARPSRRSRPSSAPAGPCCGTRPSTARCRPSSRRPRCPS